MLAERALKRGTEVTHAGVGTLRDWFPVALDACPVALWWRFMGERRFVEPFFEDSFAVQSPRERQVCRTPLSVLDTLPGGVPPTAFIFHVSRCGSTLLTQMLAGMPQCIVMSEPPVLDAFFRLHHRSPEQSGGVRTLQGLVAALGQRRDPGERHFFVKFDSWHMPWMPLVREAFPRTPIVLLYREPRQVLESHRRQRGPQMVPGLVDTTRLEPQVSDLAPGDLDGYAARMLDAIFGQALLALPAAQPLLLNYTQLPTAVWTDLLPAWALDCSPGQLRLLQARAGFHSKYGGAPFAGDDTAPPPQRAEKMDRPWQAVRAYERLEAARVSCATGRGRPGR